MICESCGVEAATRYVAFYQNIGALFARFSKSIEGNLCKSCIHRYFRQFTLTTLVLGWWGTISFNVTPFLVLNNVARYVGCLFMDGVPHGAHVPMLTPQIVQRLEPHAEHIVTRVNAGEEVERVARDVATATRRLAGCSSHLWWPAPSCTWERLMATSMPSSRRSAGRHKPRSQGRIAPADAAFSRGGIGGPGTTARAPRRLWVPPAVRGRE